MSNIRNPRVYSGSIKRLLWVLLLAPAFGQNYVTVIASQLGGSAPVTGTILFQAVGTNGQAISYQVGGGGQQINTPTSCVVTAGGIASSCQFANVLLTAPQNFCTQVTVKNSSGVIVIGGPSANSGYRCVQIVPNNAWCTSGTCDFDNFSPNLPSSVLAINMPFPYSLSLGGIYAGDCTVPLVVIGYNSTGHPDCGAAASSGGVWGTITGTLSNQTDLQNALNLLAPLFSPAFQGVPTAPTAIATDSSSQLATDLFVKSQGYAPINSPAFSGVPTAPTPATSDSSTKLATTAWVNSQGFGVGTGNVTATGSYVIGDILEAGSTNGQAIIDSTVRFPLQPSNIGTLVAGSNGLAKSATTDATNANNITSGVLAPAQLPAPSLTAPGALYAYTAVAHQWLTSVSTTGKFNSSQPACSDLSNASPSCSTDTTNASNITSGTLPNAQLPTLTSAEIPNNAANTTGTAANLSGTPALPNGTSGTTQSTGDNSTKLATDAFVLANGGGRPGGSSGQVQYNSAGTFQGFNGLTVGGGSLTGISVTGNILATLGVTAEGGLFCGLNTAGSGCVITGFGSTSGTSQIVWPAAAATATNPLVFGNAISTPATAAGNPTGGIIGSGYENVSAGYDINGVSIFYSPTLLGTPLAPTPSTNTNNTQIPTTAWVNQYFAQLASPAFTGVPTAPTASSGNNSTQIATTAFVDSASITGTATNVTGVVAAAQLGNGYPANALGSCCVPISAGGTNTASPTLSGSAGITISGSWPNQTVGCTGCSGGGLTYNVNQVQVGTGAGTSAVFTLPQGALKYNTFATSSQGFVQAAAADLINGTTGTTGTPVVLQTNPVLITPNIGAATGTSLNLSGSGASQTQYQYNASCSSPAAGQEDVCASIGGFLPISQNGQPYVTPPMYLVSTTFDTGNTSLTTIAGLLSALIPANDSVAFDCSGQYDITSSGKASFGVQAANASSIWYDADISYDVIAGSSVSLAAQASGVALQSAGNVVSTTTKYPWRVRGGMVWSGTPGTFGIQAATTAATLQMLVGSVCTYYVIGQ